MPGRLGKKLVTTVGDLMETGAKLPQVAESKTVQATIPELQDKHYGLTAVTDGSGKLSGVFSMGDLTRLHLSDPGLGFMSRPVADYMTRSPRTTSADILAARALNTMETHNIRALIVVDPEQVPTGIVGLYELLRAIDY